MYATLVAIIVSSACAANNSDAEIQKSKARAREGRQRRELKGKEGALGYTLCVYCVCSLCLSSISSFSLYMHRLFSVSAM